MPRLPRRPSSFAVAIAAVLSALLAACGHARGPRHPQGSTDPNAPVSDEAFPAALVDYVLAEPGSTERAKRAPGVVGRQVARSAERFHARGGERALTSFLGAELLLRMGELSPQVLGPRGGEALRLVAREYARRGAEGPSSVLYKLLIDAGTSADKIEAKAHLAALESWKNMQLKNRGPVARAAMLAEIAVATYLFDLTQLSRVDAEARLGAWVAESVKLREAYRGDSRMPSRDEGTEAIRAFAIAPLMLVGLYLRDADPAGAARAIQRGHMRAIVRPELLGLLEEVADSPSSENWLKIAAALRNGTRVTEGEDEGPVEDVTILRYAAFVAAIEAYRLAPTDMNAAVMLCLVLREYGMAEGIPFVVYPAVKALPTSRNLSAALGLSFEAMAAQADVDEGAGARRIYHALAPILALAAAAKEQPQPSAARIVGLMGNLELRDGNATEARALLQRSADAEPAAATDLLLAKLDRHDDAPTRAASRLRSGLGREDAVHDALLRSEVLIALGDTQRQGGDTPAATESYLAAARALFALPEGDPGQAVRQGRLLADVYDRFGKPERGSKALARATEAAVKDKRVVSAILGHRVARALSFGALPDAHAALDQALLLDVDGADLVYSATWVRLLERKQKVPADSSLDRLFAPWFDTTRWVGRVAEFSAGKRSAADLVKVAKTSAERCEAWFYAGFDQEIRGDMAGARTAYEHARREGGVTLVEYELAESKLQPTTPLPPPPALDDLDGTSKEREAQAKAAASAAKAPIPKPKPKPKR